MYIPRLNSLFCSNACEANKLGLKIFQKMTFCLLFFSTCYGGGSPIVRSETETSVILNIQCTFFSNIIDVIFFSFWNRFRLLLIFQIKTQFWLALSRRFSWLHWRRPAAVAIFHCIYTIFGVQMSFITSLYVWKLFKIHGSWNSKLLLWLFRCLLSKKSCRLSASQLTKEMRHQKL